MAEATELTANQLWKQATESQLTNVPFAQWIEIKI